MYTLLCRGVTFFRPVLAMVLMTTTLQSFNRVIDSSFIDFQVWDFPGQMDFFDPTFDTTAIFGEVGALVFVIDSQVLWTSTRHVDLERHRCNTYFFWPTEQKGNGRNMIINLVFMHCFCASAM
jgi:hypothetical protein